MSKLSDYINSLRGQKIHILGVSGTEGAEIAFFLNHHGLTNLTFHDFSTQEDFEYSFRQSHYGIPSEISHARLNFLKTTTTPFHYKDTYLTDIHQADLIFVPQSWHLYSNNAILHDLKEKIPFSSLTKLYFDLLPCPIVAITGSNGKTTTTNLVHHLAKNCLNTKYTNIFLTGNDRHHTQLLAKIDTVQTSDLAIIEISNRQLHIDLGRSPDIGILTNITPNHIEEYHDFNEYIQTKLSLFKHGCQNIIIDHDDPISKTHTASLSNLVPCSLEADLSTNGIYLSGKTAHYKDSTINITGFKPIGQHNKKNLLAALATNLLLGANTQDLEAAIKTFSAPPTRLEFVAEVNNCLYYNDLSSTVPESTILDLQALKEEADLPIILILGGLAKKVDYNKFSQDVLPYISHVVAIKSPFLQSLTPLKTALADHWHEVETLPAAIQKCQHITPSQKRYAILAPTAIFRAYFKNIDPDYNSFNSLVSGLVK